MFAIIEDGSHQFRVQAGDQLEIDLRDGVSKGDKLSFTVLTAGNNSTTTIGRPLIDGATVEAEVVDGVVKGPKIEVGKFKRRKGYIRHNGHTQRYTAIRITAITVPGIEEDAAVTEPAAPVLQPAPAGAAV
jgi:large subunit ribosomal protein L21